ncbi:MAG TPA: c-type cytochrome [Casimicrobiaceae bacterium]|nr:c-type cytochrome [Casimicrobiaceae bacterium]
MRRMLLLAAVAGMLPAVAALAQAPAAKPDLARAESIVKEVCAACHGADGNSPSPTNPSLAGQGAEYIALQLQHFQSGIRVNPIMQGMAASLKPDEMKVLGIYFSRQKPKGLAAKDATLATAGQKLYRGGDLATGMPACAACHSPNGAGVPKNYPRLAGQYGEYTYAQLKAFRDGERGSDKEGKDYNGKIMATVAARMSDPQMKALAEYASGLR